MPDESPFSKSSLLNLRARDNAGQLVVVLVCAAIGCAAFYFTGVLAEDLGPSNVALGAVIGMAVGLLASGAALAGRRP